MNNELKNLAGIEPHPAEDVSEEAVNEDFIHRVLSKLYGGIAAGPARERGIDGGLVHRMLSRLYSKRSSKSPR
ncbi:MAG: hypothetical protein HY567_01795 [Candidatus Kerfeldbacteria bacterium]|nr:hypothetical protein [Candidatus Kerfeldbacteria bacterium]